MLQVHRDRAAACGFCSSVDLFLQVELLLGRTVHLAATSSSLFCLQAQTGGRGQTLSSVSSDEQGGSFGDFIGGDLPKKLALLVVRLSRPLGALRTD
jgi:hypothetical protein